MRETIARVESTRPPGVRRMNRTTEAPVVSAWSIAVVRNSDAIGWMMPSYSATSATGRCWVSGWCCAMSGAAAASSASPVPRMTARPTMTRFYA